ncbi:hypothetical protein Tco_0791166 [Tanacetum coccineum]
MVGAYELHKAMMIKGVWDKKVGWYRDGWALMYWMMHVVDGYYDFSVRMMLLEEADLEYGLEHVVSSSFQANPGESSVLILLLFLNFHFLNCSIRTLYKRGVNGRSSDGLILMFEWDKDLIDYGS